MVPVVPLVHLDPPWTAISRVWLHEVDQARSRWSRGGLGALAGPWCWVVDQEHSGPPWSTKKLFPDVSTLHFKPSELVSANFSDPDNCSILCNHYEDVDYHITFEGLSVPIVIG